MKRSVKQKNKKSVDKLKWKVKKTEMCAKMVYFSFSFFLLYEPMTYDIHFSSFCSFYICSQYPMFGIIRLKMVLKMYLEIHSIM